MWLPILAGAGLGYLQRDEEKRKAEAQRKLAQVTATYSPWTGLTPDTKFDDPSIMGTVGQGALMGALVGKSMPAGEVAGAARYCRTASASLPRFPG